MTSQTRIDVNRRNAGRSTGPRSASGKAKTSLNSLWHGAFATDLLLPGEDSKLLTRHRNRFWAQYRPASPVEDLLVTRMILASWRLMRLTGMESRVLRAQAVLNTSNSIFVSCKKFLKFAAGKPEPLVPEDLEPGDEMAHAWIRDADSGDSLAKIARYQFALERSFCRALHELERLRSPLPAKLTLRESHSGGPNSQSSRGK